MLHNCSMQNDTSRSDEILNAFADALFEQQTADTRESGPVVELSLTEFVTALGGQVVSGPPRAPRKHVP